VKLTDSGGRVTSRAGMSRKIHFRRDANIVRGPLRLERPTSEPHPPRAYTPEEGQARLEAYRRRLAERERLKADRLS
jgi:hypothetical protein